MYRCPQYSLFRAPAGSVYHPGSGMRSSQTHRVPGVPPGPAFLLGLLQVTAVEPGKRQANTWPGLGALLSTALEGACYLGINGGHQSKPLPGVPLYGRNDSSNKGHQGRPKAGDPTPTHHHFPSLGQRWGFGTSSGGEISDCYWICSLRAWTLETSAAIDGLENKLKAHIGHELFTMFTLPQDK